MPIDYAGCNSGCASGKRIPDPHPEDGRVGIEILAEDCLTPGRGSRREYQRIPERHLIQDRTDHGFMNERHGDPNDLKNAEAFHLWC